MRAVLPSVLVALAACATPQSAATHAPPVDAVRFIENDYGRALAEARSTGRPLFVDAWAPW